MEYFKETAKKRARIAGTRRDRATTKTSMLMYQAARGRAFSEMKEVVKAGRLKRRAAKEGREVGEDEKDSTGPTELQIRGIPAPPEEREEETPKEEA
jgi:hypothetical protein